MATSLNFTQIFDTLITAVILLDEDLTVCHLNTAAEIVLGVSCEQAKNKSLDVCFAELDGMPLSLKVALEENQRYTKRRAKWRLHGDREITVDYSISPNQDMGKIVIEIQPIDRLLRISREEALLSSRQTSRHLVRSLAHEIKNPLGGIRGAAQLLSKELEGNELEECTRIIIDETDRLRNLVDRLLGPNKPATYSLMNIHAVLEHVSSMISVEAGNQISIQRDYDPSIPEILGNQEQLIQAVLNIARNAMQALLESSNTSDPNITFATRIKRRYTIGKTNYPLVAHVSIFDNGPGVPNEIIEDIFFPMITGRPTGTGLGLSISQNIIGQHGGLIECESQPGQTEFAIYLPLGTN